MTNYNISNNSYNNNPHIINKLCEYKGDLPSSNPDAMRSQFFASNPDIKEMYDDILQFNESSTPDSREARFNAIKQYAIDNSPFYAKYNVNDTFPVLTKVDLIDNHDRIFVPAFSHLQLHRSSTSGSTGIPLTVEQDEMKRKRTIADLKAYGLYANYPSHERMLQLRVYCGKPLDRNVDFENNIWRYDITYLTENNMPELIDFIEKWKPCTILSYANTLESLSAFIINHNIHIKHQCASIIVGGEMLSDEAARKMNIAFRCPVFDRYSNMEMGIYAQRLHGQSLFRFNVASYYLEVLKNDCDLLAEPGEIGRIVITDLYNHAFPMLRYDTGDLGSYVIIDSKIYLENVLGRRVDIIFDTKGAARQPHMITNAMWGVQNIKQWQFIQKTPTCYIVKIIKNGTIDKDGIITRLKPMLGNDADIQVVFTDSLPTTNSQKFRYITNEMNHSKTLNI